MRILAGLVLASLFAVPAAAAEWRQAREYELRLSGFDIEPADIRLRAGEPVRLRFVNHGSVGYRLSAPAFFRNARLRTRDVRTLGRRGTISLAPGETREILLVPAPGRYAMRSRNLFHRVLGMRGRIIVE